MTPALVLVLAAGEGTRMRSALAKVLHEVGGRPLVGHVLHAASALQPDHMCVVVGHQRERVREWLAAHAPEVRTAVQDVQRGTGHAVRVALADLADQGLDLRSGAVLVTTGDTPLLTADTLAALYAEHVATGAAATVLTAELADPTGYGRILRGTDGAVHGIVEHRDASEAERRVREINSGIYCFELDLLHGALSRLTTNNSQGEEYLTDVLSILREDGHRVSAHVAADPNEVMGVNDRVQLAEAGALLRERTNRRWMREGVTIVDPATTWIDPTVVLDRDCVLERNTHLAGGTTVASGAHIGPDTTLIDCVVGEGARVNRVHAESAEIGARANVGPFTFLRPGTVLAEKAKAGAYVEIKNARIGRGSKVPHLSYVGDATIGEDTNIGAATIFVNYDGVHKHHTVVGDGVRIGSDTMLVAPVTIADGAYTAAGSVITEDVPAGSLAVGRARQRIIEKWVLRMRAGSSSANRAEAALNRKGEESS